MVSENNTFRLFPLTGMDIETQVMLRDIRNEPNVRKWMYTDHEISLNEHFSWLKKLKDDTSQIVFCITNLGTPVGSVSLNSINRQQKTCEWAYYLTESSRGGLGAAIEFSILNFVFDKCGIEKLNCEVIEGNNTVIKLHEKFGFELEGFRKNNILKDGHRVGVHLLGIEKGKWDKHREEVLSKYKKIINSYNIKISSHGALNKDEHIIDKIKSTQEKNFSNWINLMRIAVEKSPQVSKLIINDIINQENKISNLTDTLVTDVFEHSLKKDFL